MAAPLKEKDRLVPATSFVQESIEGNLSSKRGLRCINEALCHYRSSPRVSVDEAADLYVRSRLDGLYKGGGFFTAFETLKFNQDFSPRSYFLRSEIEEKSPQLDAARERLREILILIESVKKKSDKLAGLETIFTALLKTTDIKEIRAILENERNEKVRKKAIEILFIHEPEKEYRSFLAWLDESSSKKIKKVIQSYFFEKSALNEFYPLLLTKQHQDILMTIRATEVIRCFFTDRPLFHSILINDAPLDQAELAPCDPLRHFFCRLLFAFYNAGLFPGGSAAKATGEFMALQHLVRVNWSSVKELLKSDSSVKESKILEIINYDESLRPEIIKLIKTSQTAELLESKLMMLLAPSMCILRYCTPTAWNIFDEEFRIRFKGLWTLPYWTRAEQNVDLRIEVESIGHYKVSQTKTYGVYPRLNLEDSSSTVVDKDRPYAYITFKITYEYIAQPKVALKGDFSIFEIKFTEHATPAIKKAITQSLVNYNASEEAKLAAVVEPRIRFS